jgi:apolipoprotein N-acyltransferase
MDVRSAKGDGSARLWRMRRVPFGLLAAGALTAILLDLPFPLAGPLPVMRTLFAWFALVPFLVMLLRFSREWRTRRACLAWAFLSGWFTGALWFGANCYWVYDTMHIYGNMSPAMAVVCLVAFSLYLGFWFGAAALAIMMVRRATVSRPYAWAALAAIPFAWVAMEFALARIPEFPWDLLGYSQVDNQLLTKIAPWAGVYGVSFVLAAVNALIVAAFLPSDRPGKRERFHFEFGRYCGTLGVLIAVVCSAGLFVKAPKPAESATAVLVQPNLDVRADDVWVGPEWDRRIDQFKRLGRGACKGGEILGMPETGAPVSDSIVCKPDSYPDLIAWPESPAPFREKDQQFQTAMAAIVAEDRAPLIVGNIGMEVDAAHRLQIYNSASIVNTDGRFAGRYDKIHLVPFGEVIPFRRMLFFMHQLTQNMTDLTTGTERKVFRLNGSQDGHLFGVFICYESVFGDEIRQFAKSGAEVLVNISDDGWYGDTSAPWQHLNMARMRAIENRRWILRDTNNGVTASIDPYGTVRQSIARHKTDALVASFGYSSEKTFYTEHGDWMAWICAVVSLGLMVWCGRTMLADARTDAAAPAQ